MTDVRGRVAAWLKHVKHSEECEQGILADRERHPGCTALCRCDYETRLDAELARKIAEHEVRAGDIVIEGAVACAPGPR